MRASALSACAASSFPFWTRRWTVSPIFFLPRSAHRRVRVEQHDLDAGLRRDLRDAAAHLAGPDDSDLLHVRHGPDL